MLQTVQRNVHVCMSPIPKGSTVNSKRYVCGEATNASFKLRQLRGDLLMSVLSIHETSIEDNRVTVTAVVEDMCLLRRATRDDPDQWGPGLCSTSFELADDESIPTDEDGFCSYLDQRDSQWQLVDTSDYDLTFDDLT
jgi:hypothetical protein